MVGILLGMFGLSTAVQLFKNNMANNYIKRKGNIIHDDERSFSEKLSSFVKHYAYLIVPGLNIYKAIKLFVKNDTSYAVERLNFLKDCERIADSEISNQVETNNKKEEAIEEKVETTSEIIKPATKKIKEVRKTSKSYLEAATMNEANAIINQISISDDISELENCKRNLMNSRKVLSDEYYSQQCSPERKKEIVRRVNIYDSIYRAARNRTNELSQKQLKIR